MLKQQIASECSYFCYLFLFLEKKKNEKEQRMVPRKTNDRKGKEYRVADSQRERMTETQRCKAQEQDGAGS